MGLVSSTGGGDKTYLHIIKGGIKQSVSEDTPGAIKREWETKDGKSGTKYELAYEAIEGNIVGLSYKDGDYGQSLIVDLQDGPEMYSLQISTKSRYYDDFAKKIKAVNLDEKVSLAPYDFEGQDKNGKDKRFSGITITQNGEKITSYYWDGKKSINKMPKVDEKEREELGDAYWTVYFAKVGAFFKKEIEGIKVPEPTVVDKLVAEQLKPAAADVEVEEDDLLF